MTGARLTRSRRALAGPELRLRFGTGTAPSVDATSSSSEPTTGLICSGASARRLTPSWPPRFRRSQSDRWSQGAERPAFPAAKRFSPVAGSLLRRAVRELESMTYGDRYLRRTRKLVRALGDLTDRPPEGRVAEGTLAIADNHSVGRVTASVTDLPGFSSLVREVLTAGAGAAVDASPDVPGGRPRSVRKRTQLLFNMGLATDAILAIAASSSSSWLPVAEDALT